MDTYDILKDEADRATVLDNLNARYSDDTNCVGFTTELSNIWNNFYREKESVLEPVHTRASDVETNVLSIKADIDNDLTPAFEDALNTLQDSFGTILDSKTGLIAGLNCRVLGEDVKLVVDIFCNKIFMYSFILRILFSASSFAILSSVFGIVKLGRKAFHN